MLTIRRHKSCMGFSLQTNEDWQKNMLLYSSTLFLSYPLCSYCLLQAPVFCPRTTFSPCSVAMFCPQHIPSPDTDLRLPWLHTTASRKGKYYQGHQTKLLILPQQWWILSKLVSERNNTGLFSNHIVFWARVNWKLN